MRMVKSKNACEGGNVFTLRQPETEMDYDTIPTLITMVLEADPDETFDEPHNPCLRPTAKAVRRNGWDSEPTRH